MSSQRKIARNLEIVRLYLERYDYDSISVIMKVSYNVVAGVLDRAVKRGEIEYIHKRRRSPSSCSAAAVEPPVVSVAVPTTTPPPAPKPVPRIEPPPIICDPVSLFEAREYHCRWIVGHMLFCGLPKVRGKSFCEDHTAIAYNTLYPRNPLR